MSVNKKYDMDGWDLFGPQKKELEWMAVVITSLGGIPKSSNKWKNRICSQIQKLNKKSKFDPRIREIVGYAFKINSQKNSCCR